VTVETVREAVREAIERGGAVTARGFGTYGGEAPAGVGVIDTRAMARIVEYDPADLTVTVEAGCRFDVLDAALAEHGQWLPVDVPAPAATTVGGMIAVGLAGPLRQAFGTLRDQLIGIEWVGGEGQVLRSGGRVVKNVAGYDLMKLHVGARGRFGILTTATFKVRPRPPRRPTPGPDVIAGPAPRGSAAGAALARRLRDEVARTLDPCSIFRYGGNERTP
jgi:glycolate oxidase FAD binding subunit